MPKARGADELTVLIARVRGFFVSWLVLIVSVVVGWLLCGAVLELFALVAMAGDWGYGDAEHPLILSIAWTYGATVAALVIGPPLVLLRRHIVRPDFPFLRLGYAGVAVLPFALFGAAWGSERGWFWIPLYLQAPLLVAALIYVVLARWFGLFAAGTRPDRPQP